MIHSRVRFSDFQTVAESTTLMRCYPNFATLKGLLENGMPYVFSHKINSIASKTGSIAYSPQPCWLKMSQKGSQYLLPVAAVQPLYR